MEHHYELILHILGLETNGDIKSASICKAYQLNGIDRIDTSDTSPGIGANSIFIPIPKKSASRKCSNIKVRVINKIDKNLSILNYYQ